MGLRALLNVSKGQQNKLTPMQTRVKSVPRSMNDPQAKTAPAKEAIEEVLRQCESPLLAYASKMVRDGEQAQEIVQEAFVRLHGSYAEVVAPRPDGDQRGVHSPHVTEETRHRAEMIRIHP